MPRYSARDLPARLPRLYPKWASTFGRDAMREPVRIETVEPRHGMEVLTVAWFKRPFHPTRVVVTTRRLDGLAGELGFVLPVPIHRVDDTMHGPYWSDGKVHVVAIGNSESEFERVLGSVREHVEYIDAWD